MNRLMQCLILSAGWFSLASGPDGRAQGLDTRGPATPPAASAEDRLPQLTKVEEATLRAGFLTAEKDREIGMICLRRRLARQQVLALISARMKSEEERHIAYFPAPSQRLDIFFDARDSVERVLLNGRDLQLADPAKTPKG